MFTGVSPGVVVTQENSEFIGLAAVFYISSVAPSISSDVLEKKGTAPAGVAHVL